MKMQTYLHKGKILKSFITRIFIVNLFFYSMCSYAVEVEEIEEINTVADKKLFMKLAETKKQVKPEAPKKLEMELEAGLGYDDNIYRAPDTAYIDFAQTGNPLVTPQTHSGLFIPLRFKLKHNNRSKTKSTLLTEYQFTGSFYTDSKYDNANQQHHHFSFGSRRDYSEQSKQKRALYTGLFLGTKKRLYVDRDTGENQQSGPDDLSDRYTYNYFGAELNYVYETGALEYIAALDIELRDYKSTAGSRIEYDNLQIGFAGDVKWKVAKHTKLYAGFEAYNVDYDKRPARDAEGDLFFSNPKREYQYTILSVGVRHRFNRSWLLYLDAVNKQRDDQYVSYDDYTRLLYKARLHYRINKHNKLKLTVIAWDREYDNAYAFDNITQVKKSYEGETLKLASTTQLTKSSVLKFSYEKKNQDSTDLRYVYDRTLLMGSVEWSF